MIKWIISSSCLILIMIAVRKLFKGKISPRLQYALWILVAIRLLVPVNLGSSVLSIENFTNQLTVLQQNEETQVNPVMQEDINDSADRIKVFDSIEKINTNENAGLRLEEYQTAQKEDIVSAKPSDKLEFSDILFGLWGIGIGVAAVVFFISNIVFGKRVKKTRILLENQKEKLPVYESSVVETPCLFGSFHPGIYVTNTVAVDENTLRHAVAHELTHYEQGDLCWTLIRCVCLTLHWYNPLVWWAAKLSKQDAELACDEATIKKLGEDERIAYGKTLIRLTCEKRQDLFVAATTMTSDKKSITERIQRIAKKSKLTIYALVGVLFVSAIAVGCTFTGAEDSKDIQESIINENTLNQDDLQNESSDNGAHETEENVSELVSNAEKIIDKANTNLREGYQDAKLTYVDNEEVGWNFYSDNPWSTEEERDALAQAALKELYTLTGYNVTECTYTTDGRSRFIFGKSAEYIKKCIAFYSRDYGFTLCGDSVPYQGFMNARKFHYSDVQQLASPLDGGVEEYEGGFSIWGLEHSGVYQGEKIIGHEEINKDDTVYTHVKLMFDGGYYVVVIDKSISSCHEIMGPYYEVSEKEKLELEEAEEVFYKEPQKDKVCLAVMPDGISQAGGDYRYIIPENQKEWINAYKEMCANAEGNGRWQDEERSMGIWIVYNDEWTCLTDQGFIVEMEKQKLFISRQIPVIRG